MKKFILGMITVIFAIPILESLTELICSYIEVAKIDSAKKVIIGNEEIQKLQEEQEPISTNVMGFEYPSDVMYDYEDYYDDMK